MDRLYASKSCRSRSGAGTRAMLWLALVVIVAVFLVL
jgi:hypothetical protein